LYVNFGILVVSAVTQESGERHHFTW